MSEPLSDEELGGKCSVVNLLHPTGIHFKSPTCEGWFAITAHPTPEKKEHFRQERWESVIHGFDGTLAEHHDDPCYICDHDALTTQLAEMTRERNEAYTTAMYWQAKYSECVHNAAEGWDAKRVAEATADRYKVALERIVDGLDHDRYSESSRMYRSFGGSVPDDQCCPDCAACIATAALPPSTPNDGGM